MRPKHKTKKNPPNRRVFHARITLGDMWFVKYIIAHKKARLAPGFHLSGFHAHHCLGAAGAAGAGVALCCLRISSAFFLSSSSSFLR